MERQKRKRNMEVGKLRKVTSCWIRPRLESCQSSSLHVISRRLLGRARIALNNSSNEADCHPPGHSPTRTFWIMCDALRCDCCHSPVPFLFDGTLPLLTCCSFHFPLRRRLWRKSAMLCLQRHLLLLRRTSRQNVSECPQKKQDPSLHLCMWLHYITLFWDIFRILDVFSIDWL